MELTRWFTSLREARARTEHLRRGRLGEKAARGHLRRLGLKFLTANFRGRGETDLVFRDGETLVFVEVKTRVSSYLTDPSLMVTIGKQKQIIRAADQFVKDYYPEKEWRFDIMIVITNSEYTSIEHIEDAFYPMV